MRKTGGRLSCGLLGLALCLALTSCTGERPAALAKRDGILVLGNGPEPVALDPHVTTGTAELNIQMAIYEGLVSPHPETLQPQPAVAGSWEAGEDGLTYRFHLRPEASWSDGQPVVSGDFVAGWKRALDPAQGTPNAALLYVLAGAEDYNRGRTGDFSSVGVRAEDAHTLEVRLTRRVPYFLNLLSHPVWYPVPSHRSGEAGPGRAGAWTDPANFTGNGPFVATEWLHGQYVEVERNPYYWDAASVFLNGARFMAIDEPGAEERAYLAGQLHVTDSLPPARVAAYRDKRSPDLRIDPYLGTYYILPNTRNGVLSDPKVRRALALAIDREGIARRLLGAGQQPAGGLVPRTMPGYDANLPVERDPVTARSLLADAGYPGGDGFPVLEYMFNSSESHRQIAEALQSMWREELGIEVTLTNLEWRTYLQRRASGDFDLARAVWIGDYLDPSTFLGLWTPDNPNNWAGWVDPSYDSLLESALGMETFESRMRAYALAERFLVAEQVVIPLYHYVTVYLKDPELQGWYSNLLDWHPLKYLYFE
ncbi:MAG: peptide ABC transporter substrate-binding protein [Opitutales bacterium]|jgi:oligopeptide transport system substrate-binding protein